MRERKYPIQVFLNKKEHAILQKNVQKSGLCMSAYVRSLISGYIPKEAPAMDYFTLMKELHAIGNRMNQIAAKANATGFILADEYEQNADRLWRTVLEIQAAFTLPEKISDSDRIISPDQL